MTIFVVCSNLYEDYEILCAFTDEAKAEEYRRQIAKPHTTWYGETYWKNKEGFQIEIHKTELKGAK